MRVRRAAAGMLGVVLGIIGLVGCGPDAIEPSPIEQEGTATASTEAQASTSPTPTPTGSSTKFPHRDVTDTAKAWIDASNQAMKTLDPAAMLAVSDPACENCQRTADYLRDLKKSGGKLGGDFAEIVRRTKAPVVDGATATVTFTVERGPWTEVSKAGAEPETIPSETYDIEFDLTQENGSWIVTEVLPMVEE